MSIDFEHGETVRRRATRAALIIAVLVYAATAVVVLLVGPDSVVGHFGADGQPNRYDPTGPYILALTLVVAALVGLFVSIPALLLRIPIHFVNVPQREKWNTPERRRVLARRFATDLNLLAALTVLLITLLLIASAVAGAGQPVPSWVFVTTTVVYLMAVLGLTVSMLTSGRYDPDRLPD